MRGSTVFSFVPARALSHMGGRWTALLAALVAMASTARGATFDVDFEDLSLPGPSTYYNGAPSGGGFTSRGATFHNTYTTFPDGYSIWNGWAYSNVTDVTTPGFGNQFSAYVPPGGGGDGSSQYGIGYDDSFYSGLFPTISLPTGTVPVALRLANTTYAALSMRNGDAFSKKFGGPNGTDPDWLRVAILGRDSTQAVTGSVDYYLADFRFADSSLDYILDQWAMVDLAPLSALGRPQSIEFRLATSDNDPFFGPATPLYVAVDNLTLATIPEPATWTLVLLGAAGCWLCAHRGAARGKRRPRP